ncbi:hypothetical protein [uncultured Aquitalea sp.]|uniref:hypothetical protein n=1 Tax=uncultured Aquitalea sp. TaxID=540272 RepID=UPI0025E6F629|nr:hypothetical protein [uncultured Aquitalea sp.]
MRILLTAALFALLAGQATAGGVIGFTGRIINAPCTISNDTWLGYAQHPRAYQQAKAQPGSPSCAGVAATRTVQLNRPNIQRQDQGVLTVSYY